MSSTVVAAGGIVRRHDDDGVRILLVHRPRYDDWTLPKGKADSGERAEDTARREVEEETGLLCTLGTEVGSTRYKDGKGRRKIVRYWMMDPPADASPFEVNDEVDEIRWCRVDEAVAALTYAHDRELLATVPADELQ